MARFNYRFDDDNDAAPETLADDAFPGDRRRARRATREIERARTEARDKEREIKRALCW